MKKKKKQKSIDKRQNEKIAVELASNDFHGLVLLRVKTPLLAVNEKILFRLATIPLARTLPPQKILFRLATISTGSHFSASKIHCWPECAESLPVSLFVH